VARACRENGGIVPVRHAAGEYQFGNNIVYVRVHKDVALGGQRAQRRPALLRCC
jgi:hypothetical protein